VKILDEKTICQVSLVVEDLEATIKEYAHLFDVPIPQIWRVPPEERAHTRFKGVATATRAKLAVFDLGSLVLEITEPDDQPSSWRDFLLTHGNGVHHIAFMTDKRESVVQYFEEHGMPVRHYGEYEGGNYTVFDSLQKLGVFIQVKEEKQ